MSRRTCTRRGARLRPSAGRRHTHAHAAAPPPRAAPRSALPLSTAALARTTGGLRWPEWEADDRFDIAAHVTRAALPRPGGERELLAGLPTSGRIGSTVRGPLARRAARGTRRRALGARDQDPPLPRGRRRLDRRGHGAARLRAEARTVEAAGPDASRAGRRQREFAAPLAGMPMAAAEATAGRFAIRDAPPWRSTPHAHCSSC